MNTIQYDVFLSHNSTDKADVEALARRLEDEARLKPFLDRWHLIPGEPWQEALEEAIEQSGTCAVFIGPDGLGPWEHEEMRAAIERRVEDKESNFRVIPILLPGGQRGKRGRLPTFLIRSTWVEFRESLDDTEAFRRLVAGIKGLAPGRGLNEVLYEGECPYRGLQVFSEEHARFFFGREAATEWLVNELKNNRFLAVIGPSGSGKSSLVRAGLVPALRRGDLPVSDEWPLRILKPGAHPLESLAIALGKLTGRAEEELQRLIDTLDTNFRQLHLSVRLALSDEPAEHRMVLVVDQFEELFTLTRDDKQRQAFINNLLYASSIESGQTVVILTMRADFYGKCAAYADLAARLTDHQMLVSSMTEGELRQAIERPTQLVGLEFEGGLVDTLLRDVQAEPGALPLLAHTLLELWQRREGRRLTFAAYYEIGGVQGAIAHRAEAIYATFNEMQKAMTRRIMLRLTQPGEGTLDTRRRAGLVELLPSTAGETLKVESTIQALTDAHLLITSKDEHSQEIVDVAHEALIQSWPRLQSWLDEDRAALRTHRWLTERAQEWIRLNRDEGSLLRGSLLEKAEEWAAKHRNEMNAQEEEFLTACLALRERKAAEQRARQAQLRRQKRVNLVAILLSSFIFIALSVLGWMSFMSIGLFDDTGEWTQLGNLETSVKAIAVDSEAPDTLYVGTEDGKFLKSLNRGQDWIKEVELLNNGGLSTITLSPDGTLYVGTSTGSLFRSNDGGEQWDELGAVLDASGVTDLVVDPLNPETLYICDVHHPYIYRSTNKGADWEMINVAPEEQVIAALATAVLDKNTSVVYAGSQKNLWRSTDHGTSWQNDLLKSPFPYLFDIVVNTTDDKVLLYVGAIDGLHRVRPEVPDSEAQQLIDLMVQHVTIDRLSPNTIFAHTWASNNNIYLVQEQENEPRLKPIISAADFSGMGQINELIPASTHQAYYLYVATKKGVFGWTPSRQMMNWFD